MSDDRLIVGLDLPDADAARAMVTRLGDSVGFYKIGLGLLPFGGLDLARELRERGKRVFLDMKLFDIGATVTAAARGLAANVAPDFLTVHGDPQVVAAAALGRGGARTRILAVTVLTSLDRADLDAALIRDGDMAEIVVERARLVLANPDPDQVARNVVALREPVQCLTGQEFLGDLTLELDAVRSVLHHGFHPSKARRPGQFHS
ncbi:MAG: orotidine 5'-phosphate decarboxylase [Rhodobacteraceae bacterium]|nr:orotidine 5'-phosphate decarboxylase [Paracoccaceae bacterium]